MSLNSGETLQPFKALNQLIFDSSGNLIGIQNDRAVGNDLRIGGGSGVDGTFATLIATTALKLNSGATFDLYNTEDQITNYERLRMDYSSNVARVWTQFAGTGSSRTLRVGGGYSAANDPSVYHQYAASGVFLSLVGPTTNATGPLNALSSFTQTASSGTQTAVSVSPTINQSGTAGYTALDINPTESATGSGTKLLQRWAVGGSTQAQMDAAGTLWLSYVAAINNIGFTNSIGSANDVTLTRDAADTLALRRGVNAQLLRTYETFTDASNYSRCLVGVVGTTFVFRSEAAGTGTARNISIGPNGTGTVLMLRSAGTDQAQFDASGNFIAQTDNQIDFGKAGSNRFKNSYLSDTSHAAAFRLTVISAVSGLPSAASNPYTRRVVNDSNVGMAGNYGAIVAGGGANIVPVFSDGTNWRIG